MPEFVAYRVASWDTPLRANAHRWPGRYHLAGSPATQYFGLHPLTPWAEYLRRQGLRTLDEAALVRLPIWAVRVIVEEIEAIGFSEAEEWGLKPGDLVADDHGSCQALAERLRSDPRAPKALKVPSAALPGTRNIVLFGERIAIPYLAEPIDSGDLPVGRIAEVAQPPREVVGVVRHLGEEQHPELEAWRAGVPYRFRDP